MPHATYNYYRYTRNDGSFCAIKLGSSAAGASGTGFGSPSAADDPAPYGFHPRVVYVLHTASQRKRAVPVATPAAFATLTAGGASISMPELGDIDGEDWEVIGKREERSPVVHLIH
jgi:hypothetical protein